MSGKPGDAGLTRRIAGFVVRRWWAVLGAWVVGLGVLLAVAPPFADVAIFDETAYLPPDSVAKQGADLLEETWPNDLFTRAASVVFVHEDRPLGEEDAETVEGLIDWLASPSAPPVLGPVTTHLEEPSLEPALASDDGQAWIVLVGIEAAPYSDEGLAALTTLRERVAAEAGPPGLERYVTGTPAVAIDEDAAIDATIERTTLLTVLLVSALLLYIFRSPVAALIPLVTVASAYLLGLSVVSLLADAGLEVSHLYQTFAIVIVFGAGTDYSLLMLTRYAEELGADTEAAARRPAALVTTIAVLVTAIASAAGSTVTGFAAQSVAQFGLFRTMGPALAVTVALTLVAGLTLTPALMRLSGPLLFWPRRFRRPPPSVRPRPGRQPEPAGSAGTAPR